MKVAVNRCATGGILVCLIIFAIIAGGSPVRSQATGWLAPGEMSYSLIEQNVPQANVPQANRDCLPDTKFVIRPGRAAGQTEISAKYCSVRTAYGAQAVSDSYLILPDTGVAGRIKNHAGGNIVAAPIPNSRHLIYLSGGSDGSHMYIVRNFSDNMAVQNLPDGTVNFLLKTGVTGEPVKDSAGINLSFADYRFSSNGKWMIGDVANRGMTRVNLETGETLIFGHPFRYNIGLNPRFNSSISSDGRYAVVTEATYEFSRIYDLSACTQSCAYRDMLPSLRANIPGFKGFSHLRFSSEHTLRAYVGLSMPNSPLTNSYYRITAPGQSEAGIDYLALGDSFTSGEGAYDYKPYTDSRSPFNKCHLSLVSYPYLLAGRTNVNESESVACSGAKMKDVYTPDEQEYAQHHKQAEGRESLDIFNSEIYRDFLTGYRTQNSFVAAKKPKNVTVSVSGNDIGIDSILITCLMPGTCYSTHQERINLAHTINGKFDSLVSVFQQVKYQAAAGAKIYAIGYPHLADPEGNCALNVHLDKQELLLANQVATLLNEVIRRAADKAGVSYIDVQNALNGYRLCEVKSKDAAVNGLTAGDDKTFTIPLAPINLKLDVNITGNESYHPNRLGHQLYADAIMKATRGFEESNPPPNPGSEAPALVDSANSLGVVTGINHPRKLLYNEDLAGKMFIAGKSNSYSASGLMPNAGTGIVLSGPSKLSQPGPAAKPDGKVSSDITLPDGLQPGFYTFGIETKNTAGEEITAHKTVYVAANENDIDGDGIPNGNEKCLAIGDSGQDSDRDGIDDACDAQISDFSVAGPPKPILPPSDERNTNTASVARQTESDAKVLSSSAETGIFPEFNNDTTISVPKPGSHKAANKEKPGARDSLMLGAVLFPAAVLIASLALWGVHWRKER